MNGVVAAQALGGMAAVLSVGLNLPQAWRCCRLRQVRGLSLASRWLALAQSGAWLTYAAAAEVPLQLLTNAICGVLHAAVLATLLVLSAHTHSSRRVLSQGGGVLCFLAGLTACAWVHPAALGTLAALAGIAAVVPQLRLMLRNPQLDTSGVSRATTVLALLSAVCWAGYGLLGGVAAVWVPSLVGACAALWMLVLLAQARAGGPGYAAAQRPALLPAQRSPGQGRLPAPRGAAPVLAAELSARS